MIYFLLSFVILPFLILCLREAVLSHYRIKHRRGYAQLKNPAVNHNGAVIMKISMMMSIGGKNADWELSGFPEKGIAVNIGRTTAGRYMIVSTGICNVTVSGETLAAGKPRNLEDYDVIEISHTNNLLMSWRFEYQKGR